MGGADEIPAVICYEGIFARDHWSQLTTYPWWYREAPDIDRQLLWRRAVAERIGQDWFHLPSFYSQAERRELSLEVRPEGVYRVNQRSGEEVELVEPPIGGWTTTGGLAPIGPRRLPETAGEIDELIPEPSLDRPDRSRGDLAARLLHEFGAEWFPFSYISAPLWDCYSLWGFEGMMTLIASRPDLVAYACQRTLDLRICAVREAASLGVAGLWIEDCLTDMISPAAFDALNVRTLAPLVEEIRSLGMKSIHYYCGNPTGKWELILSAGADAIALEEGKKGCTIDIEDVVERVQGRRVILGNLDAIGVLQDGSEAQLRAEVARQIAAGRRNGSRFIMSLGSPITPATPVDRVRRYCEMVRELGS